MKKIITLISIFGALLSACATVPPKASQIAEHTKVPAFMKDYNPNTAPIVRTQDRLRPFRFKGTYQKLIQAADQGHLWFYELTGRPGDKVRVRVTAVHLKDGNIIQSQNVTATAVVKVAHPTFVAVRFSVGPDGEADLLSYQITTESNGNVFVESSRMKATFYTGESTSQSDATDSPPLNYPLLIGEYYFGKKLESPKSVNLPLYRGMPRDYSEFGQYHNVVLVYIDIRHPAQRGNQ